MVVIVPIAAVVTDRGVHAMEGPANILQWVQFSTDEEARPSNEGSVKEGVGSDRQRAGDGDPTHDSQLPVPGAQ